jgi:hypothetical protein
VFLAGSGSAWAANPTCSSTSHCTLGPPYQTPVFTFVATSVGCSAAGNSGSGPILNAAAGSAHVDAQSYFSPTTGTCYSVNDAWMAFNSSNFYAGATSTPITAWWNWTGTTFEVVDCGVAGQDQVYLALGTAINLYDVTSGTWALSTIHQATSASYLLTCSTSGHHTASFNPTWDNAPISYTFTTKAGDLYHAFSEFWLGANPSAPNSASVAGDAGACVALDNVNSGFLQDCARSASYGAFLSDLTVA